MGQPDPVLSFHRRENEVQVAVTGYPQLPRTVFTKPGLFAVVSVFSFIYETSDQFWTHCLSRLRHYINLVQHLIKFIQLKLKVNICIY